MIDKRALSNILRGRTLPYVKRLRRLFWTNAKVGFHWALTYALPIAAVYTLVSMAEERALIYEIIDVPTRGFIYRIPLAWLTVTWASQRRALRSKDARIRELEGAIDKAVETSREIFERRRARQCEDERCLLSKGHSFGHLYRTWEPSR